MGLVSTQWLAEHLQDPSLRICDVRWYLPTTGRSGARSYSEGHIPEAIFIDLDRDLAASDEGREGRHPLPSAERFEAAMRRAGIGARTHVIAYDDAGGSIAARLWWLLRAHGHSAVSILDGGIPVWVQEQRPLATAVPVLPPGDFVSRWNADAALSLASTRDALKQGAALFDVRARERYQGETEPVDPRPGHIPGAINAPFAEALSGGRFLPAEQLKQHYAELVGGGGREVIASCGSGVTACHLLFGLDLTGVRPFPQARLYGGSYSEWARHAELPVERGERPGDPA
jgi:thiosulfate/3-mercaptopyruvate sulfurtransferase